ncbi:MAG: tetratricopeptide repeat protein [Gammaproteobacteria bacterium]|nr:tetratricopeptide repeat protein [Gammaproteobacteria bacterium]MYF62487.1 tetratricopeptide repeat protein [Gammaproteobacteria bacterium]MYI23557.1 tetratricopeptide repeat protein [Gammaproteobacteria bacterium]
MRDRMAFLMTTGTLLMAGALLLPGALSAQRSLVEEANRLYAEGRYAEAHEMYLEALRENPGSPLIRFNEGNALYQNQEFERALDAYRDAIQSGDTALAEGAWYNLGNSLFRQQQLDASLEAYKQALRINPGDLDAKHNLERVLEQMEEQENQQDQNQDDQDQENQDQQQPPPEGDPEQDEQDQDQPPPENDDQEEEQPAQPPPGQMTPEEAERLLQAIQEDPDEVDRPPRADSLGRRPRKNWR